MDMWVQVISAGYPHRRVVARNHSENQYHAHVSMIFHYLEHIRIRMTERLELQSFSRRLEALKKSESDLTVGFTVYELTNSIFNTRLFVIVMLFGARQVMNGGMELQLMVVLFFCDEFASYLFRNPAYGLFETIKHVRIVEAIEGTSC